jgi:excisionase family DNA binding protein
MSQSKQLNSIGEVDMNQTGAVSRQFVSVADAEAKTGVSKWTWRRWALDGKVGSVKLGKRLLIPVSEIDRLVAQNTRPAVNQKGER